MYILVFATLAVQRLLPICVTKINTPLYIRFGTKNNTFDGTFDGTLNKFTICGYWTLTQSEAIFGICSPRNLGNFGLEFRNSKSERAS